MCWGISVATEAKTPVARAPKAKTTTMGHLARKHNETLADQPAYVFGNGTKTRTFKDNPTGGIYEKED